MRFERPDDGVDRGPTMWELARVEESLRRAARVRAAYAAAVPAEPEPSLGWLPARGETRQGRHDLTEDLTEDDYLEGRQTATRYDGPYARTYAGPEQAAMPPRPPRSVEPPSRRQGLAGSSLVARTLGIPDDALHGTQMVTLALVGVRYVAELDAYVETARRSGFEWLRVLPDFQRDAYEFVAWRELHTQGQPPCPGILISRERLRNAEHGRALAPRSTSRWDAEPTPPVRLAMIEAGEREVVRQAARDPRPRSGFVRGTYPLGTAQVVEIECSGPGGETGRLNDIRFQIAMPSGSTWPDVLHRCALAHVELNEAHPRTAAVAVAAFGADPGPAARQADRLAPGVGEAVYRGLWQSLPDGAFRQPWRVAMTGTPLQEDVRASLRLQAVNRAIRINRID